MSPLHLVGVSCLACLPREDLASYSTSSGGAGGSLSSPSGPDGMPADAGGEANGGRGGEGNPTDLPLSGGAGSGDASVAGDAGSSPDAAPGDAGGVDGDAGLASQCAATQGTLVPDSSVCLFVAADARTWQAASLACQARSSTLVSVKTLARDGFLSSLIDEEVWLGAADPGTNPASNAFVWRDLTAVDTNMETWADAEPDAVADQFCVSKFPPVMGGQWRDRPCTELRAYVCERTF